MGNRRVRRKKRDVSRWISREMLWGAGLFVISVSAYALVAQAGFIWDDEDYIVENTSLRSVDGLWRIWTQIGAVRQYYPLVHTMFWGEYHLWGLAPLGYHLINVLLHATSAVLLWRVLLRLQVPGAWLAAAIFGVHPVEVESVAWITERKNVLSLTFALASLLCYMRFAPPEVPELSTRPDPLRWRWYGLALGMFAAALLSKTIVASLPAVILVIAWWKRGRITRDDLLPLAPFFLLGVALGLLTVWMERHHVGAQGEEWKLSVVERLLIAGRALWFYAAKLAWPSPLVFFYPRWAIDPSQIWQYLFPAAAIGVVLALWMARTRIGRGPLAAVLIFAGMLVPAIGFFNVYPFRFSFVADHFQYHASIALIALASAALASAVARFRIPAIAAKITVGVLLVALGAVTIRQTLVYRNLETLYLHVLAQNPGSWISYANLAGYLNSLGRRAEAIELNRRALDLAPREAVLHHNMAAMLVEKGKRDGYEAGQLEEAIAQYQAALELSPGLVVSHAGLAGALIETNRLDQARQQLRIANELNSSHPSVQLQWGNLWEHQSDLRRAEQHYQAVARQWPDDPEPWAKLGNVLLTQGKFDQAISSYDRVLKLDPDYPGARDRREQAVEARTKSAR